VEEVMESKDTGVHNSSDTEHRGIDEIWERPKECGSSGEDGRGGKGEYKEYIGENEEVTCKSI